MPTSSHPPATGDPQRTRRRRTVLVAATVTLLTAAAVGCGDGAASGPSAGATPAGGSPSSSSATASAPGSTPGEPAGGLATATGGTEPAGTRSPAATEPPGATSKDAKPQAAPARCTVTELKLTLGRGDPGAGNIYYPLDFTNTTSHPCTLDGFHGVSLLRGDGSVIGKPAEREGATPAAVRIAPGRTVQADLHTLNQGVKGDSCWRKPTLIMVYPPGSTDSMTLATSNPVVCGDTFDVGPVH